MNQDEEKFAHVFPVVIIALVVFAAAAVGYGKFTGLIEKPDASFAIINPVIVTISTLLSIPLALLFALVGKVLIDRRSIASLVWIKPEVNLETFAELQTDDFLHSVVGKLDEEGFITESLNREDQSFSLHFRKGKKNTVVGFSDHAFEGEIHGSGFDRGITKVVSRLRFDDIALVETGEQLALRRYLNHLLGNTVEGEFRKQVPLSIVCGLCLVAVAPFVLLIEANSMFTQSSMLSSISLGALGMISFGVFHITKNRREAEGFILGFIGILISASFVMLSLS